MASAPEKTSRAARRLFRAVAPCCAAAVLVAFAFVAVVAEARPERIRAGHVYYSDDLRVDGLVRDLADEKNYEEVYQSYRYYEAVYDARERVVRFKVVERGEVVREDRYGYDGDAATPSEHTVVVPGQPPETTRLDQGE